MPATIKLATTDELARLIALVADYHKFEDLDVDDDSRERAISTLLQHDELGRIWLISIDDTVVGYIAVCFGYSIEFAGRDAFIDEFFVSEPYRGRGVGGQVLALITAQAKALDIHALHLEVAKTNARAQRLYSGAGFVARAKYQLMTLHVT